MAEASPPVEPVESRRCVHVMRASRPWHEDGPCNMEADSPLHKPCPMGHPLGECPPGYADYHAFTPPVEVEGEGVRPLWTRGSEDNGTVWYYSDKHGGHRVSLLVEAAIREEATAAQHAWADEVCWHNYSQLYGRKCNQPRSHVVHDGFCVGCDSDVAHTHHLFMPKESSKEYWDARALAPTPSPTEASEGD